MPRPTRKWPIRHALLDAVYEHPRDLVAHVAQQLGLSRPAVHAQVAELVEERYLKSSGTTRPIYGPGVKRRRARTYPLKNLDEHTAWSKDFAPLIVDLPANVRDILDYAATEMINNAIDHSGGTQIRVTLSMDTIRVSIEIEDDGVGTFRKIADYLKLPDERLALLELAKGKMTTDPKRHTGEGIFFTSRVVDEFHLYSGGLVFSHSSRKSDDSLHELESEQRKGTTVSMSITRRSRRTLRNVFEQFSSGPDDYAFARTVVPIRMARVGNEFLVSRSQAKRVLERVDRFRKVVMDFSEVPEIGQAFADEVFRVFVAAHPEIELTHVNTNKPVLAMIRRAQSST